MIKSLIYVSRFLYYIIIKLWYAGRFKSKRPCLFSVRSIVSINKLGRIHLKGKVTLSAFSELKALGIMELGEHVFINKYSRIIAHEKIEIGSNVLIAQFVSILDHDHNRVFKDGEMNFEGYATKPIKIGNNVLIGDKVTILKGSEIGDNVVIGANSVIKGFIPPNTVFGSSFTTNLNTI